MADIQKDVYCIDECYLETQNGKAPVSAFTFSLPHNGIPTLVARIDPYHGITTRGGGQAPRTPEPELVSFETLIERYQQIRDYISDKQRRKMGFFFDLRADGDNIINQKLDLKNWICTETGFTSNSNGGLQLSVTLKHPVYQLTETTSNFFGIGVTDTSSLSTTSVMGADVHDGIYKCMTAYHKLMSTYAVAPLQANQAFKDMLASYEEAAGFVNDHLDWDGKKEPWPYHPAALKPFKKEIQYSMWDYVTGTSDATIWSWLINTICNEYGVQIIPDFWEDKLPMRPNQPWKDFQVELLDVNVIDMELPAADGMPTKGIYAFHNNVPETASGTFFQENESMRQQKQDALVHSEDAPGLYYALQMPNWIESLDEYYSAVNSGEAETAQMGPRSNIPSASYFSDPNLGKHDKVVSIDKIKAYTELCKQQFTEFYRRMMQISVTCNLSIQYEESKLTDNYVTSGYNFRLSSDPSYWDEDAGASVGSLLDFFATNVVHVVDCINLQAFTRITGSYVHNPDKPEFDTIKQGLAENFLYGDTPTS